MTSKKIATTLSGVKAKCDELFDPKPMGLSVHDHRHFIEQQHSAGAHTCTAPMSWADVRANRAANASATFTRDSRERENLRHRCHAIINSWEHTESDKDIALIALEALAAGAKL